MVMMKSLACQIDPHAVSLSDRLNLQNVDVLQYRIYKTKKRRPHSLCMT